MTEILLHNSQAPNTKETLEGNLLSVISDINKKDKLDLNNESDKNLAVKFDELYREYKTNGQDLGKLNGLKNCLSKIREVINYTELNTKENLSKLRFSISSDLYEEKENTKQIINQLNEKIDKDNASLLMMNMIDNMLKSHRFIDNVWNNFIRYAQNKLNIKIDESKLSNDQKTIILEKVFLRINDIFYKKGNMFPNKEELVKPEDDNKRGDKENISTAETPQEKEEIKKEVESIGGKDVPDEIKKAIKEIPITGNVERKRKIIENIRKIVRREKFIQKQLRNWGIDKDADLVEARINLIKSFFWPKKYESKKTNDITSFIISGLGITPIAGNTELALPGSKNPFISIQSKSLKRNMINSLSEEYLKNIGKQIGENDINIVRNIMKGERIKGKTIKLDTVLFKWGTGYIDAFGITNMRFEKSSGVFNTIITKLEIPKNLNGTLDGEKDAIANVDSYVQRKKVR